MDEVESAIDSGAARDLLAQWVRVTNDPALTG